MLLSALSVTHTGRCPIAVVLALPEATSIQVTALPSWSATTSLRPSFVTASPAGNSCTDVPPGAFVGSASGFFSVSFVPSKEYTRILELAAAEA